MNQKEIKNLKKSNISALFKITSQCNDFCKFCIEINSEKREDLTLEEIKTNFKYLRSNFKLDNVVLTGGEPTMHPDFIKIIEYFYKQEMDLRIITNFLKFKNESFLKKVIPFLKEDKKELKLNNKRIIGSINDLPIRKGDIGRIVGFKNVLKHKLPLSLIVVIYKDNLKHLGELISYLAGIFKKYNPRVSINIELRLMYLEDTSPFSIKASLPMDFKEIKQHVQKAIEVAAYFEVTLTLWNFPFCYIDRPP